MDKIVDKEISAELLKELKINTIEEYKDIIKDDSKNLKMKKPKKIVVSNNKIKEKIKKKEISFNKKIKNERRDIVIKSLENHKININYKLNKLDNSKFLGRKKKKGECTTSEKEENNNISEDENSNNDQNNYLELIDDAKNYNESNIINNETFDLFSDITRQNIINEIKQFRGLDEDDNYEESNLKISIPEKINIKLVKRNDKLQNDRLNLPIIKFEHEIIDKINNNLFTVICGETGSGKSTQIPQFLYEFGYTSIGKIGITQPRKVAAISLSKRVSEELSLNFGIEVGYQIRYDSFHFVENTEIKFMTDGILLKEIESDNLLLKYSIIIIDEAHERTINTDIILGFLSKITKFRYLLSKYQIKHNDREVKPLRVVIMSATMRVDEFLDSKYFSPKPSFIKVEARQYSVTVHHMKRTVNDYIEEAFKTVCKIHKKLPEGGILVFLTGKQEINYLCDRLKNEFESNMELSQNTNIEFDDKEQEEIFEDSEVNNQEEKVCYKKALILPLYSSLPQENLMEVFKNKQEGSRLIIIATNVAETSLTIPNIRYVVDSGKVKKRIFTNGLSFSTFKIEWISQASSEQRTGRAGRTGPGYCYRLYSNGLYAKMDKFSDPQILSCPLDQTILYLKSIGIKNVFKFPFLTFPDRLNVTRSLRHLSLLGCLDNEEKYQNKNIDLFQNDNTVINNLGKLMVRFPLYPRYSKILILSNKLKLIEYGIIIVSLLSIENIFSLEENDKNDNFKKISDIRNILDINHINPFSDHVTYMNLVLSLLKYDNFRNDKILHIFCNKYHLNIKRIKELIDLIDQISKISLTTFKIKLIDFKKINYPNNEQQNMIYQILLSGFIDNIARKKIIYDNIGNNKGIISHKKVIYECNENNEECKIHPLSIVYKTKPELIIYKEIISENKSFLMFNTIIKPEWLYNLGGDIVSYSLENNNLLNEPYYNKTNNKITCFLDLKYGYKNWIIPNVKVEMKSDCNEFFNWFARLLLEGNILEGFKNYSKHLNSKPNIITNTISIMPKVTMLINLLKLNKINSKQDLINKWKIDKNFMLNIYLNWIDDFKIKNVIRNKWPFL